MTRRPPISTRHYTLFPIPTPSDLPGPFRLWPAAADRYGSRIVDPVVARPSSARWASASWSDDAAATLFAAGIAARFAARSEEHTSELQSLMRHSYAGFCLKKTTYNKTRVSRIRAAARQQAR